MPWGVFGSGGSSRPARFPKKKTYSLRHDAAADVQPGRRLSHRSRTGTAPTGILKRGGRARPKSYPALADGMVPQEMAAAVPMPSEPELNAMFAQMVDELGLNRELMFKLPPQKRWELYLSKQQEQQSATKAIDPQSEYFIDQISQMTTGLHTATVEEADSGKYLIVSSDLKTALRTQPISFVLRFIEQDGLEVLLKFLRSMSGRVRQSHLHYAMVGCVKALMNNPDGRAHVLAHPTGITVIAQSLRTNNIKTKILALEILGALCLVPGGHKKVLNAMDRFQQFSAEQCRFQTLVVNLSQSLDEGQDSSNLQIAVLSFINVLINYKAGEESLEFRMHLRHEFLMLGIQPLVNRLRVLNIAHLNKHLDIFELVRIEDEKELAIKLETLEIDSRSLKGMIDVLHRKTVHTTSHTHLLSVIFHCLLLPIEDPFYGKYWHLIDRLVQQVVLQQRQGLDPDVSPVPINVQKLVQQLVKEDELRALQTEAEEVRKARDEIRLKLRKKEWECESRMMERDQHKAAVEKLKVKFARKAAELNEAWTREQTLQDKLQAYQQQAEEQQQRLAQLEALLKERNISFDDLPPITVIVKAPPILPPPPPPPQPPPPPAAPFPPPLPPSLPGVPSPPAPLHISPELSRLRKQRAGAPQPSQALKSFNWSKLPDVRIERTIWSGIDDSKIHAVMDLSEFEHTFSAYQPRQTSPTSTLRRRSVLEKIEKPKELSVIDGRRAQNCTILLSKLKMSDEEIRSVIVVMDAEDCLSRDMVEQLLKYVPTNAERDLLETHSTESETFARADHFLWEMSKIPRYGERLRSLFFKKTLDDCLNDIQPRVEDLLLCCKELMGSKKLRKALEVILAFGNFMNRGHRGHALGFKLNSLTKIVDTKSSTDRDMTLLHYLIKILEEKFRDVLTLDTDLPHLRSAAKVDLAQLDHELNDLKTELGELERELRYHHAHSSGLRGDQFLPAMEEFSREARKAFIRLTDLMHQMRGEFEKTVRFFGEDPEEISTEEFFGIFATFMQSFNDAHVELLATRKRKEEEERRKEEMQKQKEMTISRRRSRLKMAAEGGGTLKRGDSTTEEGEFDKLITILHSGEFFDSHRRRRFSRVDSPRNSRLLEMSRERMSSLGGAEPMPPHHH